VNRRKFLSGIAALPIASAVTAQAAPVFVGWDLAGGLDRTVVYFHGNGHVYAFDGARIMQWSVLQNAESWLK
jgi:hypothetical protein